MADKAKEKNTSTSNDVVMGDASSTTPAAPPKELTPEELNALLVADLKKNITLLERTVATKETRLTSRVLRSITSLRRKFNASVLRSLVNSVFTGEENSTVKQQLLSHLQKVEPSNEMDTSTTTTTTTDDNNSTKKKKGVLPEVEVYVRLLVTIFLLDKKHYHEAIVCSESLVQRLQEFTNRRTLNPLSSKAYFYYARAYELTKKLEDIRGKLFAYYRTATLKHNDEAQATLLNLLLRNYLEYNLYDQADKLVSKVTFREDSTSSNQYARYLYYQGKIKSVQLDYTEAYRCLLGASRKAPQNSARGFRLAVYKLACIVQLLMGEIPERSIFRQPGLKNALSPYLQLTQTVRIGDLDAFHKVVNTHEKLFKEDKTFTLIQRLRHNVIKAGLRKINVSYSRISFDDICKKLHLESADDVEFIVAKAIKDGVISATINHQSRYIQSKETLDVYSTQEPQAAYHRRISFCLNTHNEAVKAMRYPPDAHKGNGTQTETAKERKEREQEIAKNFADEEDEF